VWPFVVIPGAYALLWGLLEPHDPSVRSWVLATVNVKITVFSNVSPCSLVDRLRFSEEPTAAIFKVDKPLVKITVFST
jgi:hypothetical protein